MATILFQPTPPVGAETGADRRERDDPLYFNPLRPWGRRPGLFTRRRPWHTYFNPLRPWGRRRANGQELLASQIFQPTPPVGAETRWHDPNAGAVIISTHSARGGGDLRDARYTACDLLFQPTPPVGAETCSCTTCRGAGYYFNPLRPWGRRPRPPKA